MSKFFLLIVNYKKINCYNYFHVVSHFTHILAHLNINAYNISNYIYHVRSSEFKAELPDIFAILAVFFMSENKFDAWERKFNWLERKFNQLELKFNWLERKFNQLERKFNWLERKFNRLERQKYMCMTVGKGFIQLNEGVYFRLMASLCGWAGYAVNLYLP